MKPSNYFELVERVAKNPLAHPPIMVWGAPGIGKSAIPRQVTRKLEYTLTDIRGPLLDPSDLRGIPAVIDGKAVWLPPSFLPTKGPGLIILDELVSAPPLVQAAMYQLVLDRAIGEYRVPDDVAIMAAGNRLEDRAVVYRMPTPLKARFIHVDLEVSQEDWIEYAIRNQFNPNIISFIQFRGELLWQFKPESSENAFPNPRTWEFASRAMALTPPRMLSTILEGTVGKGATAEFIAFLRLQTELPDPETVLNGSSDFWPIRSDLKYAFVGALATRAKANQYDRLIKYSEKIDEEFSVLMLTMLLHRDRKAVSMSPAWEKWARNHGDIIWSPGKDK